MSPEALVEMRQPHTLPVAVARLVREVRQIDESFVRCAVHGPSMRAARGDRQALCSGLIRWQQHRCCPRPRRRRLETWLTTKRFPCSPAAAPTARASPRRLPRRRARRRQRHVADGAVPDPGGRGSGRRHRAVDPLARRVVPSMLAIRDVIRLPAVRRVHAGAGPRVQRRAVPAVGVARRANGMRCRTRGS